MTDLYPELEDYIYNYCDNFQTAEERLARNTLMYSSKTTSEGMLAKMKQNGWISEDPNILAMTADGYQALKHRVVERIWREHRDMLYLNLCPRCHKITRTPQAKQCRFCHYNWH